MNHPCATSEDQREESHHWIVVVKATYEISPDGKLSLSEKPEAPLYTPQYNGKEGRSSLRYEADLVAMKPASSTRQPTTTKPSPNSNPPK